MGQQESPSHLEITHFPAFTDRKYLLKKKIRRKEKNNLFFFSPNTLSPLFRKLKAFCFLELYKVQHIKG